MTANYLVHLCERLKRAMTKVVKEEEDNHISFDNVKDELIIFMRRRKPELKRRILEARVVVRKHTMSFNTQSTRWLRVYLDTELQFKAHNNF